MNYKAKLWCLVLLAMSITQVSKAQCISGDCENGRGVYKYSNGEVYKGQFRNGVRDGMGTLTDNHKHVLYSGHWYPENRNCRIRSSAGLIAMKTGNNCEYIDAEHAYYRAKVRAATVHTPFNKPVADKDDYYIVIEKSQYKLDVYNTQTDELMVTYPVVFGNDDLGDKMCEGDRKTPEGTFYIINKKQHKQWDKYLALSYPSEESYEKFKERKAQGLIASNVGIGGGIGLHGTWAADHVAVDRKDNWTSGCISTKNCYIDELFTYIPVGTKVIIRR